MATEETGIRVRHALPQDYEGLTSLFEEVDRLHQDHLPDRFQAVEGPIRPRSYVLDLIAREDVGLFVAEQEAQLVGFVHVRLVQAPDIPIFVPRRYAFVENIAVKGSFRRQGVGWALMEETHRWAAAQGAESVELNVYGFNEAALAFYRDLGYGMVSQKMCRLLT